MAYFQSLRIERAVHLLKTSKASVEEVGAQVGYMDGGTLRLLLRRRLNLGVKGDKKNFLNVAVLLRERIFADVACFLSACNHSECWAMNSHLAIKCSTAFLSTAVIVMALAPIVLWCQ
jgi:AraC-like DNA-binding protein